MMNNYSIIHPDIVNNINELHSIHSIYRQSHLSLIPRSIPYVIRYWFSSIRFYCYYIPFSVFLCVYALPSILPPFPFFVLLFLSFVSPLLLSFSIIYYLSDKGWKNVIKQVTTELDLSIKNAPVVYRSDPSPYSLPNSIYAVRDNTNKKLIASAVLFCNEDGVKFRSPDCPFIDPDIDGSCIVSRVGVLPDYHNKGVGKLLISHMIHEAKNRWKRKKMILLTSSVQEAAIHLYTRLGFRLVKKIPYYPALNFYELVFELQLNNDD